MAYDNTNGSNGRRPYQKNTQGSNRRNEGEGKVVGFKNGQPIYRKTSRQGGGSDARTEGGPRRSGTAPYPGEENNAPRRGGNFKDRKRTEGVEYPFKTAQEQAQERPAYGGRTERPAYGGRTERPAYGQANRPQPRNAREEERRLPEVAVREDELPFIVMGRNAVREALKSGRSIDRIQVVREQDGSLREILSLARDLNVQIREVDRNKLDELCMPFGHGGKTGNHQGIIAQVPGVEYCEISDILAAAQERGEQPFVILLDSIEDPYNLGSIIRSAECAGAHGVIIPRRRSASVTAAASKASAGAVAYMRVARVSNLTGAISRLKDAGLWIVGADMQGQPMGQVKMQGAIGLVIGGESDGMSKLVRDNCDFLAAIPMKGKMDSLNASVAAAVLMFEKGRQDGQ